MQDTHTGGVSILNLHNKYWTRTCTQKRISQVIILKNDCYGAGVSGVERSCHVYTTKVISITDWAYCTHIFPLRPNSVAALALVGAPSNSPFELSPQRNNFPDNDNARVWYVPHEICKTFDQTSIRTLSQWESCLVKIYVATGCITTIDVDSTSALKSLWQ